MEEKEKAEELVSRFLWIHRKFNELAKTDVAKECALIAIEELICNTPMYTGILNPKWSYW